MTARSRLLAAVAFALSCCAVLLGTTTASAAGPRARIERPTSQASIPSSTSGIRRTLPCTELWFDYGVDSEQNFDYLRVLVDGALQWSESGLGKRGRKRLHLTPGSHQISFEYLKDGSVDRGADTGWISSAGCTDSAGVETLMLFTKANPLGAEWTKYGYGGGFSLVGLPDTYSLSRPASQAFTTYQSMATTSSITHCYTWGSAAGSKAIKFNYYSDSEENYDYARAFVDGTQIWQSTGREKAGQITYPMTSGLHCVKFAYTKDTSADWGADTARIDAFEIIDGGKRVEHDEFDDDRRAGFQPYGWTCTAGEACWTVERSTSPRAVTKLETLTSSAFVVDGKLDSSMVHPLRLSSEVANAYPGKMLLASSRTANRIGGLFAMPVYGAAGSTVTGNYSVVFDAQHDRTIGGRASSSCGSGSPVPGPEDRRFTFWYSAVAAKGIVAITTTVEKGNCNAASPWTTASGSESWGVTASGRMQRDAGAVTLDPVFHLTVEVSWLPPSGSGTVDAERFGFAATQRIGTGLLVGATFPSHIVPDEKNPSTWGTVAYEAPIWPAQTELGAYYATP